MSHPPESAGGAREGYGAAGVSLRQRTALVTGASSGIGLAICRALGDAGARLWLVARTEAPLRAAAASVGGRAIPADVAEQGAVERLHGLLTAELGGPPDIVVNAAGAFALAPAVDTPVEAFDRMLAVNLRAPFLLMRAFLPGMLARGTGHVVTIGSIAGRVAFPHNAAYCASKFGVRGLHAVLDAELRGTGVRATLLEPAATDTPLWDGMAPGEHPGLPARAAMLAPEAVADAVVYALTRPPDVDVRVLTLERT